MSTSEAVLSAQDMMNQAILAAINKTALQKGLITADVYRKIEASIRFDSERMKA